MAIFTVKVSTKHDGCKRTCKLDVKAKNWLAAGRKAMALVRPQGPHRLSITRQKGSASVEFAATTLLAACYAGLLFNLPLDALFAPSLQMLDQLNKNVERAA